MLEGQGLLASSQRRRFHATPRPAPPHITSPKRIFSPRYHRLFQISLLDCTLVLSSSPESPSYRRHASRIDKPVPKISTGMRRSWPLRRHFRHISRRRFMLRASRTRRDLGEVPRASLAGHTQYIQAGNFTFSFLPQTLSPHCLPRRVPSKGLVAGRD